MKESLFKKLTGLLLALILLVMTGIFFTNDSGLLDLRKTSIIIGVGLDFEGEELKLTAQLAVPQASENGADTQFTTVEGEGKTVACCLNDVNVKTGFYPKLVFCKLVLLGESCMEKDINTLLNYFYDNEYTGLTPIIAACKGEAGKLLSVQLPFGDSPTDSIQRLLSEEAQKSGNVATTDLNKFGQGYFSESGTAHMPYIIMNESTQEGGGTSGSGGSGEQPQGGGSGGSGGGEGQAQGGEKPDKTEFLCNRMAVFEKGYFKGVLDEQETFAFNLLNSKIRHAYTECTSGEERLVLGLRHCKGGVSLEIESGAPVLKLSFSAVAKRIVDENDSDSKKKSVSRTSEKDLESGEKTLTEQITALFERTKELNCDVLNVRELLYKKHNKYYETLKDSVFENVTLNCDVKLKSTS